jgi:hypothetical protein
MGIDASRIRRSAINVGSMQRVANKFAMIRERATRAILRARFSYVQLVSSSAGPRVKTIVTKAASKVHKITQ